MKKIVLSVIFLFILLLVFRDLSAQSSKAEKAGWRLGVQAFTFHKFSFQEAVDKTQQLGLKYLEVYYGQILGKDIQGTMDFRMDQATQQKVLAYARSKGVKIIASGVIICKDEAEWRQLFEFASAMEIEMITCEPEYKHLKYIDQLANKYKIDVAIHNHPKPSAYWNSDLFLDAVKELSSRIGACADVGHWKRMGIDPVVAIKKCEGRLKSLHFKDIKEKADSEAEQHDVEWGTGVCNVEEILSELKSQNFKGLFSIEYEYNWDNSVPDIQRCIGYFNKTADKIF